MLELLNISFDRTVVKSMTVMASKESASGFVPYNWVALFHFWGEELSHTLDLPVGASNSTDHILRITCGRSYLEPRSDEN